MTEQHFYLTNDPVNFEARERRSVSRDSLYDRSSNPSRASIRFHSSGNLPSSSRYSLNREPRLFQDAVLSPGEQAIPAVTTYRMSRKGELEIH